MSDSVGSLHTHDHPCSLYETPEQLKQQFVPYLQAGLLLDEYCVYFVDENTAEFVLDAMRENGFNLDPHLERGQFQVIDTKDAHLAGGFFNEDKMLAYWNSALAEGHERGFKALRAAVEMTWALSGKPGCDILAPYESRLTKLMQEKEASVICMYSRRKFSPEKIKAIIHAHPLVVTDDVVLPNPSCPKPENFVEGCADLDVQALVDNLALIQQLTATNTQLSTQKAHCETLYQELNQLARVVSHEMQEPLRVITSYLRLLSVRYSEKLGDDADEFIHKMNDASELLLRMIDDLWSYARIDSADSAPEMVDSMAVLGEVLSELRVPISETKADIIYTNMPTIPCRRQNLKTLFKVLIDNACKYRQPEQRPQVNIRCIDSPKNWRFEVSDNGVGIDTIHRSDLFKIYQRLNSRPSKDGTGMGLAIARRILQSEGGDLDFDSEPGKGSTFHFSIPKRQTSGNITYLLNSTRKSTSDPERCEA